MDREEYLQIRVTLKKELKEEAKRIKQMKLDFKQSQRDLYKSTTWSEMTTISYKLDTIKKLYRIKHVVYSMLRGKNYIQIEPKVREGNEIDSLAIYREAEGYGIPKELIMEKFFTGGFNETVYHSA